ncbi:MAG TPA: TatD family hydrolase [Ideonella sp.]|jgi:TatD DNase family protein|nr:TatD family hydrolase [Ideonella sp.]
MFVDSHCHLSFPELHGRLPQILADMREARVAAALCICTTLEEFATVQAMAAEHDNLWASVGVHPDTEDMAEPSVDTLCTLAAQPKVIAIGETGLDYYRLNGRSVADMAWQRDRFRTHIRAAQRLKLPLIIHTRSASEDTIGLLKEEGAGLASSGIGGVFHCFTETMEVARAALDLGFHISFSGIVSFRNAADLREVARYVPLERCLIETDSPYLAPVPYRGKTNSPAYVPHVAAVVAAEKGLPVEQIAEATTHNFERLFQVQVPKR